VEQLLSGANERATRGGGLKARTITAGRAAGWSLVVPSSLESSTSLRIARDTIVLSCDIPYVGYCRKDRILRASTKYARTQSTYIIIKVHNLHFHNSSFPCETPKVSPLLNHSFSSAELSLPKQALRCGYRPNFLIGSTCISHAFLPCSTYILAP
jgi:hypothetical protein